MAEVTAQTYDEIVRKEGLQFQIDTYFEPKEIFHKRRVQFVLKLLNPQKGERILDVGCGVGTFAIHSAKAGAVSTGIDYSIESLNHANAVAVKYGLSNNCTFVIGSAFDLPFKNDSFDKVSCIDFIEHITDNEKVDLCKEITRVLKPGGAAVIYTPNKIREDTGEFYWKLRHFLFGHKIPRTDLHYGLITRQKFELILNRFMPDHTFYYYDVHRPYLSKIPLVKHFLALNLIWVIKK